MMDSPESEHAIRGCTVVIAAPDQVSTDLEDEVVILNVESGVYYSLDNVGAFVWGLVQEPRTVHQLRDAVLEEYEVEPDRCERDIVALLKQLADAGIVKLTDETPV